MVLCKYLYTSNTYGLKTSAQALTTGIRSITCYAYINKRKNCDLIICLGAYRDGGVCDIVQSCIIAQSLAI